MPDDSDLMDGDQPLSNVDDGEEMISEDISLGEGAEVEELPDTGFEALEGYQPPAPPGPAGGSEFTTEAVGDDVLSVADETTQLRDIGEASFGPAQAVPETVHGADDRVRITNTKSYPWRAHASLRITAADDSLWIGTGWFVGPKLLVTAGHVVYITNSGVPGRDGWVKRIVAMPGRDGATLPYGSVTSSRLWTVVGWANNGNAEYDYGAIVLDQPLGNTTGWFGFGNWSNLDNVGGNISGYPGDKPAGTQWYAGRRIDSTTSRKVFYDIDTAGGQSGSAVYRFWKGGRYGIAIHAYGGTTVNSGTRINSAVFKNLKAWKQGSET
jgi:V8-like Glu-specific endopeptidase